MELSVRYRGGTRFHLSNGKHQIVTDQPVEDGGTDAGMSPVELFVASLAGCVAYFATRFCHRHGISTEGLLVDVEWETAERPHRVGRIDLALRLPAQLSDQQRERLLRVMEGCTVHQSMLVRPEITMSVTNEPQSAPVRG